MASGFQTHESSIKQEEFFLSLNVVLFQSVAHGSFWQAPPNTMSVVNYKIPREQDMQVMGSLLSHEADTMSTMRHNMNKAMSAMRSEVCFYKNPSLLARRKHKIQAGCTGQFAAGNGRVTKCHWKFTVRHRSDEHN